LNIAAKNKQKIDGKSHILLKGEALLIAIFAIPNPKTVKENKLASRQSWDANTEEI
jgi:hypothetical protein